MNLQVTSSATPQAREANKAADAAKKAFDEAAAAVKGKAKAEGELSKASPAAMECHGFHGCILVGHGKVTLLQCCMGRNK
jgi:hypothetical protein